MVTYEEMLELAACGARVLMLRCVEYARRPGVKVHVRSSFTDAQGTWVLEEDERMEKAIISGVPHDTSEAKVTLAGCPTSRASRRGRCALIADEAINVDMIVQNVSHEGTTDISFTVPKADLGRALRRAGAGQGRGGRRRVLADDEIAKVSLVGAGMKSHPGGRRRRCSRRSPTPA